MICTIVFNLLLFFKKLPINSEEVNKLFEIFVNIEMAFEFVFTVLYFIK